MIDYKKFDDWLVKKLKTTPQRPPTGMRPGDFLAFRTKNFHGEGPSTLFMIRQFRGSYLYGFNFFLIEERLRKNILAAIVDEQAKGIDVQHDLHRNSTIRREAFKTYASAHINKSGIRLLNKDDLKMIAQGNKK